MLDRARFICPVPVVDRERARAFYVETLGLPFVAESEAGILVALDGGARILLFESAANAGPGPTVAGWEVGRLERLEALGVVFEDYDLPGLRTEGHIARIGPERAAWFRDSEGNILAISEPWTG